MNQREELVKRRDSVLGAARAVAEKARTESRELTADETAQIDSALTESREINEKLAADDRHKNIMSQLNAQAASSAGLIGDGQRLAFGKSMAAGIATKMLGDGLGTKTLAPSGAVTMQQEFQPSPIALGQPANSLLSVLRLVTHDTAEFSYLRQTTRTNAAAVVAEGAQKLLIERLRHRGDAGVADACAALLAMLGVGVTHKENNTRCETTISATNL